MKSPSRIRSPECDGCGLGYAPVDVCDVSDEDPRVTQNVNAETRILVSYIRKSLGIGPFYES